MRKSLFIISFIALSIISCDKSTVKDIPANWGKVYYIDVLRDYGIVMDDGVRYAPVNLEDKFQVDGLPVLFDFVPVEQASSWGQVIRITRMQME